MMEEAGLHVLELFITGDVREGTRTSCVAQLARDRRSRFTLKNNYGKQIVGK